MKVYGLVGHPLSHSFSEKYFQRKFEKLDIKDCSYQLFDLKDITKVDELKSSTTDLKGFNVTIPYKETIIPYVDSLDESALMVGAVNVVKKVNDHSWRGYNSDYYGFKYSLESWLPSTDIKSLVLGTGGASKAIVAVLQQLNIEYQLVSRSKSVSNLTYRYLGNNEHIIKEHQLIINTTPVGMYPNIDQSPEINYKMLSTHHFLYDLVYNPAETKFLKSGKMQRAQTKNGLEMLELQAEKSWKIWNAID